MDFDLWSWELKLMAMRRFVTIEFKMNWLKWRCHEDTAWVSYTVVVINASQVACCLDELSWVRIFVCGAKLAVQSQRRRVTGTDGWVTGYWSIFSLITESCCQSWLLWCISDWYSRYAVLYRDGEPSSSPASASEVLRNLELVSELSTGFDTSTSISSGSQTSALSWPGMFTYSVSHLIAYRCHGR